MAELVGKRYQIIGKIGAGGMGAVYRTLDRLTGDVVALKRVTVPEQQLVFTTRAEGSMNDFRLILAQEFRLLASLRHPNVISVLDYGFEAISKEDTAHNRTSVEEERALPFFTMEYLQGAQSIQEAAKDQPMAVKIDLLTQMIQALAYLHRRGIIHRDLKPDNVVVITVTEEDGSTYPQVKLLDFGLAIARQFISDKESDTVSGTLAYMAPEVLQGIPPAEPADLYAVGVIMYEIFAGEHPFDLSNIGRLIQDTVNTAPDMSMIDIDDRIEFILRRLLAKQPEARYTSANELLAAFIQATDQQAAEETEVRESFLQAAEFVGREDELALLTAALNKITAGIEALAKARTTTINPPVEARATDEIKPADTQEAASAAIGSMWLIGGESGSGKTRLMDELRAHALVNGARVLRGRAVQEASAPYPVWRELLRPLVLQTSLSELESSVLKVLLPDIGDLLSDEEIGAPLRVIADAVELTPDAAQDRLLGVIEDVLLRQRQPIVLALEDLQWAVEDLLVLRRITRIIGGLPIMIVGTFRNDEKPELPTELPQAQVIHLKRLTREQIAALSASILGEEVGRREPVIKLLESETEGNIQFIIEVVRALAEEVGNLNDIGRMSLPQKVFAGGIEKVIQRRIERMPMPARPLLRAAAVAGRELDLKILHAVEPSVNLDQWLQTGAEAAVLDVQDGVWRFAHEKLRKWLLIDLNLREERNLNAKVASAIESVYSNDSTRAAVLAYHWARAENPEKEAQYALIAGTLALQSSAYEDALNYLTRALELNEGKDLPAADRAQLEYQLGRAHMALGHTLESRQHLEAAIAYLGYPTTSTQRGLIGSAVAQLWGQIVHNILPRPSTPPPAEERAALLKASDIYEQLAELYYFQLEILATANATLKSVNLAERAIGDSSELAISYGSVAVMYSGIPLNRLANSYADRAVALADRLNDPRVSGWAYLLAAFPDIGTGNWTRALERVERAIAANLQVGDIRRWETCQQALIICLIHTGQYKRALQEARAAYRSTVKRNDAKAQIWSQTGLIEAQSYISPDEAEYELDQVEAKLPNSKDLGDQIATYGMLAWMRLRRWELEKARRLAQINLDLCAQTRPLGFYVFPGYSGTLATFLELWENEKTAELKETVKRALKFFKDFIDVYPFATPYYYIYRGRYERICGNTTQAIRLFEQGLRSAQKYGIPYAIATAHYKLGKNLPASHPQRIDHLRLAAEIFGNLGAQYDLDRTLDLMPVENLEII